MFEDLQPRDRAILEALKSGHFNPNGSPIWPRSRRRCWGSWREGLRSWVPRTANRGRPGTRPPPAFLLDHRSWPGHHRSLASDPSIDELRDALEILCLSTPEQIVVPCGGMTTSSRSVPARSSSSSMAAWIGTRSSRSPWISRAGRRMARISIRDARERRTLARFVQTESPQHAADSRPPLTR